MNTATLEQQLLVNAQRPIELIESVGGFTQAIEKAALFIGRALGQILVYVIIPLASLLLLGLIKVAPVVWGSVKKSVSLVQESLVNSQPSKDYFPDSVNASQPVKSNKKNGFAATIKSLQVEKKEEGTAIAHNDSEHNNSDSEHNALSLLTDLPVKSFNSGEFYTVE